MSASKKGGSIGKEGGSVNKEMGTGRGNASVDTEKCRGSRGEEKVFVGVRA